MADLSIHHRPQRLRDGGNRSGPNVSFLSSLIAEPLTKRCEKLRQILDEAVASKDPSRMMFNPTLKQFIYRLEARGGA